MRAPFLFALIGISLVSLSACGLRGSLERPVPLWGNPPNEGPRDPRTLKEAEEKAKAEAARREAEERGEQPAEQPATPQ